MIITSQEEHRLNEHISFSTEPLNHMFAYFSFLQRVIPHLVFNTNPQIFPRIQELRVDKI